RVCQRNVTAPHCQFPLYWAPPSDALSNRPGVHRWSWDLRYDPLVPGSGESATGAVPGRTYRTINAPWAVPGIYTVRLTANGKSYTQPITVRLDPRVKISATALAQLNALTKEMRDGAVATRAAYDKARALSGVLTNAGGADAAAFKAQVDSIAPASAGGGGGRGGFGGRGGAPQGPANLESAANQMIAAAMQMAEAEAAPTANNVAACTRAREASRSAMARWTQLSTAGLTQLNARRKAAGLAPVTLP
ncbi:MAG: glycoside hydrolase, partial [Gemmatimonadota bacterium]|nr:glycoside hydrolase [Gemmatimonadota bacterium]